jgi:hypothetical protein
MAFTSERSPLLIHVHVRRCETSSYSELYRPSMGIGSARIVSAGFRRKVTRGGAVNVDEENVSLERSEDSQRRKNLKILTKERSRSGHPFQIT